MNGTILSKPEIHLVNMVKISQFVIFAMPPNNATKLD